MLRLKKEGQDNTHVRLLYSNRKEEDILLHDLFRQLSREHDDFTVDYILSQPSETWRGHTGHVTADLLEQFLPGPSADVMVYVCGPPGFMKTVCGDKLPSKEQGLVTGALLALGYSGTNCH